MLNKATGKPKGTAFIEFESAEAAQSAAAASQAKRDGNGPGVSLKGKQLEVHAALVQDSARALAQEQSGFTGKGKDKRNLYLVCCPPLRCRPENYNESKAMPSCIWDISPNHGGGG